MVGRNGEYRSRRNLLQATQHGFAGATDGPFYSAQDRFRPAKYLFDAFANCEAGAITRMAGYLPMNGRGLGFLSGLKGPPSSRTDSTNSGTS